MKVILDTNFLMVPFQFKVDILSELDRLLEAGYEAVIPDKVLRELKTLSQKGSLKVRKAAKVALQLAEGMKKVSVEAEDPDSAILAITEKGTVVCTNDRELRRRVLEKGGRVVFLRQRRTLALEGGDVAVS
ncbi:MAG: nucleotide-binding protein [Methanobacteriota archaeon]|nr:MAG: nucleotide-binding protein [Euryarchaeota archaeon]